MTMRYIFCNTDHKISLKNKTLQKRRLWIAPFCEREEATCYRINNRRVHAQGRSWQLGFFSFLPSGDPSVGEVAFAAFSTAASRRHARGARSAPVRARARPHGHLPQPRSLMVLAGLAASVPRIAAAATRWRKVPVRARPASRPPAAALDGPGWSGGLLCARPRRTG